MASIKKLIAEAKARRDEGYNIIIFPEGTRTALGERKEYLPGISALYKYLDLPIVPIALNSGAFWPRNAFVKKPGVIDVHMLPAIVAGENAKAVLQQLQQAIETECEQLMRPVSDDSADE